MNGRTKVTPWVIDALQSTGGKARIALLCRMIWDRHQTEILCSDLVYTWQYDIRWAVQVLRTERILKPARGQKGPLELADCMNNRWPGTTDTYLLAQGQ